MESCGRRVCIKYFECRVLANVTSMCSIFYLMRALFYVRNDIFSNEIKIRTQ